MTVNRTGLIGILVVVLTVGALVQASRSVASPQTGEPATLEQVKMFEDLLRIDERVSFQALVNGDVSGFATIYYNDPTVELNPEFHDQLARAGDRAAEVGAGLTGGPKGATTGFLTAQIAGTMLHQRNVDDWMAAQAKAKAEGRQPTLRDMPAGEVPFEPKQADEWVDVPFYVYDVFIQGNHATATLSYAPPEDADSAVVYQFVQVDDHWYISGATGGHITTPIKPRTTPYLSRSASE